MKQVLGFVVFVTMALCVNGSAHAAGFAFVQNGDNDGPGSLRAALNSGAKTIRISRAVDHIVISETLTYAGSSKLTILGSGQIIDASGIANDTDIFVVENGANLSMFNLSLIGNYTDFNDDSASPEGGKGIFVDVPIDRTGLVRVLLKNVSLTRVGNHGVHVSDCTLGDACASGSGGGGDGSPASIYVQLYDVLVNRVGFGKSDADGIRVDDRGDGSIYLMVSNSKFLNVGADGIELDEGDDGNVVVDVKGSIFDSNGEYCNLPEFYVGTPCDDDGDRDVDDGFDIDEAGDGSIYVRVRGTKVSNNFDEGLDFDEEDEGGIEATISDVIAIANQDEGIKMSEENGGNVDVELYALTTVDNNGDSEGIELEEADDGNVDVVVSNTNMIGGEDEELKLEQDDAGTGVVEVSNSIVELDLDGVVEL